VRRLLGDERLVCPRRAGSVLQVLVAELPEGEVFGELAARNWGRGYGSPRTATVTAATDLELLVLPEGALETVMRLSPRLTAAVEAAAATRLP